MCWNMKRLITKSCILIITFFIVDYFGGIGLDRILLNSPDGRYYKARYSLSLGNEEMIIFGASTAEMDYVPRVFENNLGVTCWNAGRGGQNLPFWRCIELELLNRYSPKIVLIDVNPELLSWDNNTLQKSYESAGILKPFYNFNQKMRPILNSSSIYEKYFLLSRTYAYNSSFYYLFRPYFFRDLDGKNTDKGWKPLSGRLKSTTTKPYLYNTSLPLNPRAVVLFNEFIDSFVRKGCRVFITYPLSNNEILQCTSTKEYIKRLPNITIVDIDGRDSISTASWYFKDSQHLNEDGAIKYSNLISRKIRDLLNKE